MTSEPPAHLSPDEFRRAGYALVDWIASYHERVGELPVKSRSQPGDVRAALPASPPDRAEPFDAILADIDRVLLPGLTHWQSPSFFGFFPANASPPAILGDLLSSGLGVQGMLWATSPAVTELETLVLDWLVELCGLPDRFRSSGRGGGVIQDSASSASLCALLAARSRAGADARELVAYTSDQSHSSIEKDARVAGIPHLRAIASDGEFAMRPDALGAAVAEDVRAGRTPFFVTATVGTTSSCAVDPVASVADIAAAHRMWLHVDAAYAGSATVCAEHRDLLEGLERADSYVFNPHKWLLTNFDCSAFFVADRRPLVAALSIVPEYLRNEASESGQVVDYRDWQVPLGRRFRALKLWFVIRSYGAEGLRRHIRHHVALARDFAGWVDGEPGWEIAAPPRLGLVCLRALAGGADAARAITVDEDELNQRILDECNQSGRMYLTHTRLDGRLTLRMSIGGTHTRASHVQAAWDQLRSARRKVMAG
jgi:aromatic-L-amino-acid decarboxylase